MIIVRMWKRTAQEKISLKRMRKKVYFSINLNWKLLKKGNSGMGKRGVMKTWKSN